MDSSYATSCSAGNCFYFYLHLLISVLVLGGKRRSVTCSGRSNHLSLAREQIQSVVPNRRISRW